MTTNGVLFNRLAEPLAKAGLQRVNFSLDTLDPARFKDLTRNGDFDQVWAGIQAAEDAGLVPIKINSVIVQDCNKQDIIDLAGLTLSRRWQVRFIEMMPFAGAEHYQRAGEMRADGVKAIIEAEFGSLEKLNGGQLQGEAMVYRIPGAIGSVGFIASVSRPFCESCSRARLTADGHLRLCLLREMEVDLLTPMREGASDLELRRLIQEGIWEKPWGHLLQADEIPLNRTMSQIGG
jgi:cyclic pyranopterin phosphate synthase